MATLAVVGGSAEGESDAQPFLFSESTINELTEAEKRGEYTLERLREKRPEVIDEIIRLRGEWAGMLRIAKICRVHHRTVAAVCAAYPEAIGDEHRKRVHQLKTAADLQVEQLCESPESVPWNVRGLVASQLYDKALCLEGQPSIKVEHTHRVDIYSDWPDVLAKLEREAEANARVLEIEGAALENPIAISALNVPAETHLAGEKQSPISDSPPAAIAAPSPGDDD
jgi:hypothetical protein